jgi:cell division protein FtsI (penicillin-binding protein 3)
MARRLAAERQAGPVRRASALRRRMLIAGLMCAAAAISARAFQLSVLHGGRWEARALDQQADTMALPAPRGTIYDRDGVPLAASRDRYRIAVARREVADVEQVVSKLRTHAGLSARKARGAATTGDGWVVLPGLYDETVRGALAGIRGLHFERVSQRFYPHDRLAAEVLGTVNASGEALGGIELEFDSLLSGRPGRAIVRRDALGRALPGLMLRALEPVPGQDIVLTLDVDLQEIADDALRQALGATEAAGGELLLLDPSTGEVLAAVSRRQRGGGWGGVTVPYEPGSTLKPFTVAALLAEDRATLGDSIFGEDGSYTTHGRTITDVHAHGWMTLEDALRESSNIGIAKAADALTPDMQYAYLRAFGFGSPTGASYPSESGGLLRRPRQWSKQSKASLAIGYEVSVTPLQMALAYGALANGGLLMEPRLVREVRARDGRSVHAVPPRVVRRVVAEHITDALRDVLADVVEEGTGTAAQMGEFRVAGKTGTARIALGGRYVPGAYTATFAGYFPADTPELVFVVKLDRPRGAYYGGATAAPVTRATLEAALAARGTPIDKRSIARAARRIETTVTPRAARFASHVVMVERASPAPVVLTVGGQATRDTASTQIVVPDVAGLALRDAAARLHTAGFHVRIEGSGVALRTVPETGTRAAQGRVVRIVAGS